MSLVTLWLLPQQTFAQSVFILKESKFYSFPVKQRCICEINKYIPPIIPHVYANIVESKILENKNTVVSKNEILNCLIKLESSGIETKINPHDTDGNPRYGLLQYYLPTWYEWCVGKYNLPNEILNGKIQLECATRMIFEDKQGWRWPPLKRCL